MLVIVKADLHGNKTALGTVVAIKQAQSFDDSVMWDDVLILLSDTCNFVALTKLSWHPYCDVLSQFYDVVG